MRCPIEKHNTFVDGLFTVFYITVSEITGLHGTEDFIILTVIENFRAYGNSIRSADSDDTYARLGKGC